jgi:hypothetical protein
LISIGGVEEFRYLTQYAENQVYAADLDRIRDPSELRDQDVKRTYALCDYLLEIHQVRGNDPGL